MPSLLPAILFSCKKWGQVNTQSLYIIESVEKDGSYDKFLVFIINDIIINEHSL